MKTKFYWVALLASAALIAQTRAGNQHGGGGGNFAAPAHASPGHAAASGFQSAPRGNFGGGRMIYSGQRFSSAGMHAPSSAAFPQHYINSNGPSSIRARQFTPGNITRGNPLNRSGNNPRLAQSGNRIGRDNRAIENHANSGQIRHGNNLPANWRNHVVAHHSGDWHRDWDRGRDHWWHGHHCRFVDGSWVIFDLGFYPWWPYYDYYPYDYAADPYTYDSGYDSGGYQGETYYDQNGYESSDQSIDSTVAAAQEQLARQGYYRGDIDGVLGPETRRAVAHYQSRHGLRVTGALTTDTLRALGLPRVASR
jgi:hypothetical protein